MNAAEPNATDAAPKRRPTDPLACLIPDITPDRLEDAAHDLMTATSQAAIYARVGLAEWVAHHFDEIIATSREYRDRSLGYELDEQAAAYLRDGSREAVSYINDWLMRQEAA